ncbi:MAG: MBOAT family protein [Planctomycetota bacterium]|nr:MAG: MBOAT family protein [Planctomycetota bacterium]
MAFHSWHYGLLLLSTLLIYWMCANQRAVRTWLLLFSSLLYYGAFEPWFLWLLLFTMLLDYGIGRCIGAAATRRAKLGFLWCSLLGNLLLLAYFKYSLWLAELSDPLQRALGTDLPLREYAWKEKVPVGISFYTFQSLSYTIDVFRGTIQPLRSLRDFSTFVAFFPQLVAGPIVRAKDFLPQMEFRPRLDRAWVHDGIWRIAIGLAKKTLLADMVARYLVDPVYAHPEQYSPLMHLVALYAFSAQIYCDFSGYSDIAIGSARLFGFELLENFDAPYRALSIREFWRRWHISLSSWVRDYLFFPLGGSRGSESKVAFNLMVTMVIIGLWHGASTLWLIYGVSQGAALILERWLERMRGGKPYATTAPRKILSWFLAFHFTTVTCALIRAPDMASLRALFGKFGDENIAAVWGWVALAGAAIAHFLPDRWVEACRARVVALPTPALGFLLGLLCGCLFLIIEGQTSFIYFQF